jgi:hypothetical protein
MVIPFWRLREQPSMRLDPDLTAGPEQGPVHEPVPIRDDDSDFIDRLLETNAAFRRLCEERKREVDEGRVVPLAEARRRLLGPESSPNPSIERAHPSRQRVGGDPVLLMPR